MVDIGTDCGCGCGGSGAGFPSNPTTALNYHFGMLLGVEDLRAEQAFHVGRMRRHQREAHGAGVLRGLAVEFAADDNEIKVYPGFAIDRLGCDVEVDHCYCVRLPDWFAANAPKDPALTDANNSAAGFALLVTLQADACLERPVQAIAPECNGSGREVAYSRLRESFHLDLKLSAAPPPPEPRPALTLLLEAAMQPADPAAPDTAQMARLRQLWQAADATGAPEDLALFLKQAQVLEQVARTPNQPSGDPDDGAFAIARIEGIRIRPGQDAETPVVTVERIDLTVRPVLLPTAVLQGELLEQIASERPTGPRVTGVQLSVARDTIAVSFDRPLEPGSVQAAAFTVSTLEAGGFAAAGLQAVAWDAVAQQAALTLAAPLAADARALLTAHGTGPAPLVDPDLHPLGQTGANGAGHDHTTKL